VLYQRARELGTLRTHCSAEHLLQVSPIFQQPSDALFEAPALGIEVVTEGACHALLQLTGVVAKLLVQGLQNTSPLLPDRVGIDPSAGLAQSQDTDLQRLECVFRRDLGADSGMTWARIPE